MNKVIGVLEIQLSEEVCLLEQGQGSVYKWKGILIFNGDFVEPPIVDTRVQDTVLLLDKEEPRSNWGRGGLNCQFQLRDQLARSNYWALPP